ncbi:S-layer homology domain-containing protein [Paenibacillus sp. GSMTC-2017]|uniref:S-layer homology domain-containing protein n=1 Tax=Paenibacillus sp. GSMTC-2017 TaxID=2794350 RepID=UPI0018D5C124|nr:S-layer homology domain-containing protein [Paenibacillus sp. GSMTC-2017]MBH5320506.1 S-layer homology domain-containing protein [Paenibacillus sp. GSMTC-2017]
MRNIAKKIMCSLLIAASFGSTTAVTAVSNSSAFTDIEQSYAKDAINRLVQQGILRGVDETHFNPKGYLTRAEFTAILVRALKLPIDQSNTTSPEFSDVKGWAVPYINSARNAGIVDGVGNSRFNPDGLLTREQAAKLLISAITWSNAAIVLDEHDTPSFVDSNHISVWAKPYVAMAEELNLISGSPDGTFNPISNANREMAAVMGVNLLDSLNTYSKKPPGETAKPSAPTQFSVTEANGASITFTWIAPSDVSGIAGYDIFMGWDGIKIGSTAGTSFTLENLDPNLSNTVFYVKSKDAQGQLSDRSNEYIFIKADKTNLTLRPHYSSFTYNQVNQVSLTISGYIKRADAQQRAKLYVSIDKVTSKDITFGSVAELGAPEIVQEGSQSQPLVVAWGGPQGFELSAYVQYATRLKMSVQIPTTLHKKGFHKTQFELRTAGANPVGLASSKALMTGSLSPV